ncbi:LysR family transcriptional regulator [Pontibacillus yanchengensis]|uniref:LysR family transcriptional regulator n=1 Tax=Pontibacillus yanchengensis Y32 TaxID=1385514 RepID=A0A0A2TYE8_9BACI|nr:LysR family transcriptional regulator [Pontibacillus yanchengensis]KGP74270.1 LysR family transcriptional regulator [Pontibacillus yanchengensis Y32]
MELSWLNTFITVEREKSFRKAADVLFVSQPTVTVHIKSIEKELGVSLFERNNRFVKLTEEGRRFLGHAQRVLAVHQEGMEDMHSFTQGYRQKLSLAISPSIADTIMPTVLKGYLKRNPEVEINVDIRESVEIEEAVRNEEVDIGFSLLPSHNNDVICYELYEDEIVFCVPHDGYDDESAPLNYPETFLQQHYLFTHNYPGVWDSLHQKIKSTFPQTKSMKVSQVHITKRFIASGLGVSFLPKSAVRRELLEGRILEVPFPEISLPNVHTFALTKYNHTLENDFIDFVSNHQFK